MLEGGNSDNLKLNGKSLTCYFLIRDVFVGNEELLNFLIYWVISWKQWEKIFSVDEEKAIENRND